MAKSKSKLYNGVPNQVAPSFIGSMQEPSMKVTRALKKVPRDEANIEAEKGETVYFPNKGGLPAHFNIDGNRHTGGGTPLNVPKDSFVFSDTKKMKIKDPELLLEFGKSSGSWTPADLAKKYDINKYRKLLQDPNSDAIEVRTAEKMISNYNLKLGKLALIQESKKGFPQGIPAIAMPYFATYAIEPDSVLPLKPQDEQEAQEETQPGAEENESPMARYGIQLPRAQYGGGRGTRRGRVFKSQNYGPFDGYSEYTQVPYQFESPINQARTTNTYNTTSNVKKTITVTTPPKGSEVIEYDPSKETSSQVIDKNKERLRKGDVIYLKRPDGVYEKITPKHASITTIDQDFENKDRAQLYEYLKRSLKDDKNKPVIEKMYMKYRENIVNSKLPEDRKKALLEQTPEQVRDNFLKAQKQIYRLTDPSGKVGPAKLAEDIGAWNTTKGGINKKYSETAKALNMEELKPDEIAGFQAAYRGFSDISDDPDAGFLKEYNLHPVGAAHEKGPHMVKGKPVSTVDDLFGAATAGQAMTPTGEYDVSPYSGTETVDEKAATAKGDYTDGYERTPFFLQDVINTGAAAGTRLGLKKYLPWAPMVAPRTPEAYFKDPTRELAANAEQMDIGTRGAAAFSGPQAYNARYSQIAGQGAKNAANILGRYHNDNIDIANKFSALKADIYNRADQSNAAIATDLYNKTTIANQQFDNSKRQANNELRESFVNAITNRANAQTLNMMYPHFKINPITGGNMEFYRGDEIEPGSDNSPESRLSQMQHWKGTYPGWNDDTYAELAGLSGKKRRTTQSDDYAAIQAMMNNVGG